MERIKKEYPRLPVCIQGDALYATEPMMKLCREKYHQAYIFTQKDTCQKLLDEGFEWIKSGGVKKVSGLCEEKGTAAMQPCGGNGGIGLPDPLYMNIN